jgi:hypothetical protein
VITERAMLAAVHISVWSATKHDKQISREVAAQHGAHQDAGRYNKKLLKEAEKLEALRTLAGKIRAYFYLITLPWSDEGYRILPAHLYFELSKKMQQFEQEFHSAVDEFVSAYPSYVEDVKPALNGLFRTEDYPEPRKIREKFELRLEILPIPTGNDFRVALSEEQKQRISGQIDRTVREALARGTEDLWLRLRKVVAHMVDRLQDVDGRLHASVVDNISELVDVLPHLNIAQDAQLDAFVEEVKTKLCGYTAKQLKQNQLLRATTASDAAEIVSRISELIGFPASAPDAAAPAMSATTATASVGTAEQSEVIFSHMAAFMGTPQ